MGKVLENIVLNYYRNMKKFIQTYKRPICFIQEVLKDHKKVLYLFVFWQILWAIFYILLPVLAKFEIDQLVEKNTDILWMIEGSPFLIFIVILSIIFFIKFLENIWQSIEGLLMHNYTKILENDYLYQLYKRLWHIELGLFLNKRNKRFISNVLNSSYQIWNSIRSFLGQFITNVIFLFWVLAVFSFLDIKVFLIILISSCLVYFLNKYKEVLNLRYELGNNYELEDKLHRLKYEMSENLHRVVENSWEKMVLKHFSLFNDAQREIFYKKQKQEIFAQLLTFVIENLAEVLIKLVIWIAIFQGTQSVGFMTMALLYISRLESVLSYIREFRFESNRILDMLLKLDLFLWLTDKKIIRTKELEGIKNIEIKNLSFTYPNTSQEELKYFEIIERRIKSYKWWQTRYYENELDMIEEARRTVSIQNQQVLWWINISFQSWKLYGIVWKNGSGKSTLMHLLLWFFSEYSWNILYENIENKNIKKEDVLRNFSVIWQVPYILHSFTIRDNLLLWVEKKYTDIEIYGYLQKFGLEEKIKKLRKWLDTIIGYDSDFSWWELQLFTLVRVILQDKKVIILDEWTNQLDAENELKVMEELLKNKEEKIIIFITHRMTTIRKADMIYCLEKWNIIDKWIHTELLKQENNIYKTFWNTQVVQ